ncbi:MAG: Na(+)/H(+) antiporter subunit D [Rhodospirillales bacterium]
MSSLNPGLILVVGAVLVPLLPQTLRRWYLLALPIAGFIQVHTLADGASVTLDTLGMTLEILRVDAMARVWGYIFNIAAFLALLFAWHNKDTMQQVSAPIYAGAALGAVFAGDLVTLFVFWELTAISSVFLIWASRSERAYKTGMRYLLIQVGSGVILLTGVLLWYAQTGSITFDEIGIGTLAGNLIFIAFGIKCAFPLLHNWLQDSYPEATVTGTVVLSAFTTKLAVYALARGYAGTEELIYVGATMVVFPIFYAVIENDLRRVLAYALNNQLGFMVVGIGIGTELSLNGTAAHAFSHILYKSLLFMSMGAVLYRTGTCKASELGGLYKSMPLTMGFCIVGSLAMSAPLFCGFITKSMILSASAGYHWLAWSVLVFGSVGVFLVAGIRVTYSAFFADDRDHKVKEAPWNMLLAMGLTAFLCVYIGVNPNVLYDILPYPVDYEPYTVAHVITQLQLLIFTALGFTVLVVYKVLPPALKTINLVTDWIYRRLLPGMINCVGSVIGWADRTIRAETMTILGELIAMIERQHGSKSTISRTMHAGTMALIVLSVLFLFVLVMLI